MSQRARRLRRVVASMVMAMAVASGVAPATAETPAFAPVWGPCSNAADFECATVPAPLDYEHPGGRTIELKVIRRAATDSEHRIGSLLFNPGGPGGKGTSDLPGIYSFFPQEIRDRFDIVSWDPRGVGQSTAVQCFATAEEEVAWFEQLPVGFPVGREEERRWIELYADLGRRCQQRDPELLRFVSTTDSAHDLDLLRSVLGDQELTYYGISYGTLLGATYANLFPDRVRAMVLDGNVDPSAWYAKPPLSTFLRINSDLGSAETLTQFFEECARAGASRCPFAADTGTAGSSGSAAIGGGGLIRAKYETLMARLRAHPQGEDTYAAIASVVIRGLYFVHPPATPNWPEVAQLLQDLWLGETSPPPSTGENPMVPSLPTAPTQQLQYPGVEQILAVTCGESPNPRDPHAFSALAAFGTVRSGTMGPWWAWTTEPCSTWPGQAAHRYTGPWNRSSTPILTVNTTYDPATPYRDAKAMTAQLGNARLLTVTGYGHTELINPSSCAAAHESAYVVHGVLPPPGTVCRQDTPPFTEPAPAPGG